MRTLPIIALASLVLAASGHAEVDLTVTADRPTRVYAGEAFLGDAPLTVRGLQPGTHKILVEQSATGLTRTYMIPSPEQFTVERELRVSWTETYSPPPPPPASVSYRSPPPPPPPPAPPRRAESIGKTHTRNVLLGATAVSTIFTKDSGDRKRRRNVGLGAIGLNEILRR